MGTLNIRGHEILDTTPIEIPLANMKRTPSIFERMQAIIMQQQKDAEDAIRDEADMMEDLNDFSYEDESSLFTEDTKYTVSDDVPDYVSAKELREKAKAKAQEKSQSTIDDNKSKVDDSSSEKQRPPGSIGYPANAPQGLTRAQRSTSLVMYCAE